MIKYKATVNIKLMRINGQEIGSMAIYKEKEYKLYLIKMKKIMLNIQGFL